MQRFSSEDLKNLTLFTTILKEEGGFVAWLVIEKTNLNLIYFLKNVKEHCKLYSTIITINVVIANGPTSILIKSVVNQTFFW